MQYDNNKLELAVEALKEWKASPKLIQKILLDYPEEEQDMRAYYILSIRGFLMLYFSNPQNQIGFMILNNHTPFFNGLSPIELIGTGSLSVLKEVESRVRNMGEW